MCMRVGRGESKWEQPRDRVGISCKCLESHLNVRVVECMCRFVQFTYVSRILFSKHIHIHWKISYGQNIGKHFLI